MNGLGKYSVAFSVLCIILFMVCIIFVAQEGAWYPTAIIAFFAGISDWLDSSVSDLKKWELLLLILVVYPFATFLHK